MYVERKVIEASHHETPRGGASVRVSGFLRSPPGPTCSALLPPHAFFHLFCVLSSRQRFFNLFCRPAGARSRSAPVLTPGRPCLSLFNDAEPGGGLHLIMGQPRALIGQRRQLAAVSALLMSLQGRRRAEVATPGVDGGQGEAPRISHDWK